MNVLKWIIGSTMLGSVLAFGLFNVAVYAEKAINKPVQQPSLVYKNECSECHLAYPAGFLPAKSWDKILATLDDHFGENAELDKETMGQIKTYLDSHAMRNGFFNRLMRNFPKDSTPLRITKLPFFIRKHDEISEKWVKKNPEIGSFSQCDKCHRSAARGDFDEDNVRIPGARHGWGD